MQLFANFRILKMKFYIHKTDTWPPKNYIVSLVSIMAIGLLFTSCGDSPIYNESFDISDPWNQTDSVIFELPAPDTSQAYALVLNVSHTTDYPFQNIYFKISTSYPSGRYTSNILNIDLADKRGVWYGDCRGQNCELSAPLREHFAFSETGIYQVTMEQFTRLDPLPGLSELELELWPSYTDNMDVQE